MAASIAQSGSFEARKSPSLREAAGIPLPPSRPGSVRSPSDGSSSAEFKEARQEAKSAYYTAKLTPSMKEGSLQSLKSYTGISAKEPLGWTPPKPVDAMSAAHFGEQVAKLAAQTKVARNVMPMIVRGGVIASLGMFLFGHMAPLAIIAVMVGAVVGGYAIAKFMQLRQAKAFAALGENNPLALLQKNMPEDASAADKAKLQTIINFVEKGDIFGEGMLKTFREPYRAIKNKLAGNASPALPTDAARQDAASIKSNLSAAQQEMQDYLNAQAAKV